MTGDIRAYQQDGSDTEPGATPESDLEPASAVESEAVTEPDTGGSARRAGLLRNRLPRPLTVVAALAIALFAVWGVGGPLFGHGTTAATSTMVQSGPWPQAGFNDQQAGNDLLYDTYTSATPGAIVFKKDLQQGQFAGNDPNGDGGGALGVVPNDALLSPLTIPYYVLPTWLGPAYTELLIIICSFGGTFLFMRRLGLSRVSGLVGGLAYASSGFMVVWVNFPQSRTAAFLPALFWVAERFVQTRRVRDAALIAVPVAAMLLGGFPAVTGYALVTATCYVAARLIALHRLDWRRLWRPVVGYLAGVGAGFALVAFQLLPFEGLMKTWMIIGRSQTSAQHMIPTTMLTMVAPWAFGTGNPHSDGFYLASNAVETVNYIGAAALVLMVVATALPWRAKLLLPRSVWSFLIGSSVVWLVLNYVGGPLLGVLQKMPVVGGILFGQNPIGRSRSVLGFLFAVLVGVGFDVLMRRKDTAAAAEKRTDPGVRNRRRLWVGGVGVATVGIFVGCLAFGYGGVTGQGAAALGRSAALSLYEHQIAYAVAFILAACVCVAVIWWVGHADKGGALNPDRARMLRGARFTAAAALPLLLAWQGGTFASEYFPRSPVNTFYPVTDTHSYLAANLGEDRYASTTSGMVFGTNSAYPLRAVNGHNFINQAFGAMIDGIPGGQIQYETYIDFGSDQSTATSPILDQLGAKYWVAALSDPVIGLNVPARQDSTTYTLEPGKPVTVSVPATGPLRAVSVTPTGAAAVTTADSLDVVIKNAGGNTVATTDRLADEQLHGGLTAGTAFEVPVAADAEPAGTAYTATLTWKGAAPLTIAADAGAPALGAVAGQNDGLQLVQVGDSAIYARQNVQPRIRWASTDTVITGQGQRMNTLTSGQVTADQVVLSSPGPAASGQPAVVNVTDDGNDTVSATVDAKGAGYLVVADADQAGWKATVDGASAKLRAADQGVVAIAVPAGTHTVTLDYSPPHFRLGLAVSGLTAVGLVAASVGEVVWLRRRRRGRPETARQ